MSHRAVIGNELTLALERFNSGSLPVIVYRGVEYGTDDTSDFIGAVLVQENGFGSVSFESIVVENDDGTVTGKMYLHGIDSQMVAQNERAVFEINFEVTHNKIKTNYVVKILRLDFIGGEVDEQAVALDTELGTSKTNFEHTGKFTGNLDNALLAQYITILDRGNRSYLSSIWVDTVIPIVEESYVDVLAYFATGFQGLGISDQEAKIEQLIWKANLHRRSSMDVPQDDFLHDVDLLVFTSPDYSDWVNRWYGDAGISNNIELAKERYRWLLENTQGKPMKTHVFSQYNELLKERFAQELKMIKASLIKAGVADTIDKKDTTYKPENDDVFNSNDSVDTEKLKLLSVYELEHLPINASVVICDAIGEEKNYHRCTIISSDEDAVDFISESKDTFTGFKGDCNGYFAIYNTTHDGNQRIIEVFKELE